MNVEVFYNEWAAVHAVAVFKVREFFEGKRVRKVVLLVGGGGG